VYIATDVKDLYDWMVKHFTEHPLFEPLTDEELKSDIVAEKILDSTEEGKKVTRNKGDKFMKVFRRIPAKISIWEYLGIEAQEEYTAPNEEDIVEHDADEKSLT